MYSKLVSVIIPVYNTELYLEECLESVVSQTYKNLEIIIIDDGSTDGSIDICLQFAQKDSRIRFIKHEENQGIGLTRKEGILCAKGEFIAFVDSDDYVEPLFIEKTVAILVKENVDIVSFGYKNFFNSLEYQIRTPEYYGKVKNRNNFLYANTPFLWDKVFRREVLTNLLYFDINFGEDECILIQAIAQSCTFFNSKDRLYWYRNRNGSLKYNYNNYEALIEYIKSLDTLSKLYMYNKNLMGVYWFIILRIIDTYERCEIEDYKKDMYTYVYRTVWNQNIDSTLINFDRPVVFTSRIYKMLCKYSSSNHFDRIYVYLYKIWLLSLSYNRVTHYLSVYLFFVFRFLKEILKKLKSCIIVIFRKLFRSRDFSLLYWPESNVGDTLAPVIFEWALERKKLNKSSPLKKKYKKYRFISTVGSVIGLKRGSTIVWGSGILSNERLVEIFLGLKKDTFDIRAVRGPLTANVLRKLTIKCPHIYGDPAILMPSIYQPTCIKKKYKVSVILHHEDTGQVPEVFHQISVCTDDYKYFIDEIVSSELVVSSSLHGIILAETYGVPAIWFNKENWRQSFKFLDWYYSTGRTNVKSISSLDEISNIVPMNLPDLTQMQQDLLNSFPYDIYE